MTDNTREYLPRQRAALIAWHLAHGEALTTEDVARIVGLKHWAAWKTLVDLSAVIPIYQDDDDVWQVCYAQEEA